MLEIEGGEAFQQPLEEVTRAHAWIEDSRVAAQLEAGDHVVHVRLGRVERPERRLLPATTPPGREQALVEVSDAAV